MYISIFLKYINKNKKTKRKMRAYVCEYVRNIYT